MWQQGMLRKLFNSVVRRYKEELDSYKPAPWKRPALIAVGILFLMLALVPPLSSSNPISSGAYLASTVFGLFGGVGVFVGLFGSDDLVAKLFGGI